MKKFDIKTFDSLPNKRSKQQYIKSVDLRYANMVEIDLSWCTLMNLDFRSANLEKARLVGCILIDSSFRNANLNSAYLESSDVRGVDFNNAVLIDVDIRHCSGNEEEIKFIDDIDMFDIVYTQDQIAIGCHQASKEQWKAYSLDDINDLEEGFLGWWSLNKEMVLAL